MTYRAVKLTGAIPADGPVAFGARELERALSAAGYTLDDAAPLQIILAQSPTQFPSPALAIVPGLPESYSITRQAPDTLHVVGRDPVGLMYACLDLAEQLAAPGDLSTGAGAAL